MQTLRRVLSTALSLALLIGVVAFATRSTNQSPVDVNYLFGESSWPLWQLVGGSFLAGALAAWLMSVPPWMRSRFEVRRHRKQSARLESELHELRNLPLSGEEQTRETTSLEHPAGDSRAG